MSVQGMRPARLAGLALIVIAVVATGLGVFALTSNGAPQAQGRPPVTGTTTTTRVATTTGQPTGTPTTSTQQLTTSFPSGQTTTIAPPPTTTTPSLIQTVPVRVFNNSMIPKLAATATAEFRAAGFNVVQTGNDTENIAGTNDLATSTVFYTSLPGEQQVAEELGRDFHLAVRPRTPQVQSFSPGVIVIVTKDFQGQGGK